MALLWIVPVVMLLAALAPLPYGFYTLLRLVVCAASIVIAYLSFKRQPAWGVGFIVLALLFNPFVIVGLPRDVWAPIDVAAAILFSVHYYFIGRGLLERN